MNARATAPLLILVGLLQIVGFPAAAANPGAVWQVGAPVVTYWCGPSMTEATARQMADGGWNLVWCTEEELDTAQRHGLRAQLTSPLLSPAVLDDPAKRAQLDALIERVRRHPALYDYFITDEPSAAEFAALGRLVAHLRDKDPAHLAYINLFPTYATNKQLGNDGDTRTAYQHHLQEFIQKVHPALISYDHYQFSVKGDNDQYFLNLALVRDAAREAGLPFLNIVQACTWSPAMRVPKPDEMRYLVYTTLAYGAQGISYYVYSCAGHTGAIARADGTPTELYEPLSRLNREFVAIARTLQHHQNIAVYHAGMRPPGTDPLPSTTPIQLDPPITPLDYRKGEPVKGVLVGLFAPAGKGRSSPTPTHAVVVNLDYAAEAVVGIRGTRGLETFNAESGIWSGKLGRHVELHLPRGGGTLVRLAR